MTIFTERSNARRAAKKLLADGESPSNHFEIKPAADGGFEIEWIDDETAAARAGAPGPMVQIEIAAPAGTPTVGPEIPADPQLASVEIERLIAELERRGYRATQARRPRAPRPAKERQPSKAQRLDEAAARGVMPEKPVMTSATNQHYQKRFDRLAELAAAGDWSAIAAYEVKGNNTYAKEVARYRDRLLTAHAASQASA